MTRLRLPRALAAHSAGLLLLVAALASHAAERPGGYLQGDLPALVELLAPPPLAGSDEEHAELQAVLALQRSRTPSQAEAAAADAEVSPFRFADVLGPAFARERVPLTAALLDGTADDLRGSTRAAKDHWNRPRPAVLSPEVTALAEAHGGSYPSGHATYAYVAAIVLARMLPERQADLFARARRYADNRVVAGVHFPSDVEAGRIAGTVIADRLLAHPDFQRDLDAARVELRAALGYPDPSERQEPR